MGKAWYQYSFDNPQGAIEPYGGGPKPDSNVQCPDGTPITALLPGTISGLNAPDGSMPAWGAVVTIRLDTPINSIATHTAYLHLMPLPTSLRVGQHVNAGATIGYSGGAGAAGAQKVPVGFALYNGDVYGYGPTWSQYVGNPLLNPYGILTAASGGHLNIPASSGASGSMITDTLKSAVTNVAPNADVTTLLYVLDQVLLLTNPFQISGVQQDSIAGATFTDPVAWVQQFGQNVADDFAAGVMRLLFILLGLFILYKVASTFIDPSAVTQTAVSGAATVGKLAALGAPAGV